MRRDVESMSRGQRGGRAGWGRALAVGTALALSAPACGDDQIETRYHAEIRWTEGKVPHVTASELPDAFFGQGYAFASLGGCILADQIVKVRSERASFFGPGPSGAHVTSDFAHLALGVYANAVAGYPKLSDEAKAAISGYVAGFNRYLELHRLRMPCAAEAWLRPLSEVDLFAHYLELSTFASGRAVAAMVVAAQPPTVAAREMPDVTYAEIRDHRVGSNGWAIGSTRSASGKGMLLANPHFPWEGELKLYESHLTVPGKLDVYGASLMGVLGVLIGFNSDVAWTHTVSDGQRFTLYQLQLDPRNPTAYLYDGSLRFMDRHTYEVQVLQPDGSRVTQTRDLYRTHFGPVVMLPPVGWTRATAFAIRDANAFNPAIIDQILRSNQATSLAELQQVHDEVSGLPWVNTMATSKDGRAWYVDSSATPALAPEAITRWLERVRTDPLTGSLAAQDLTLLPGNSSLFEWQELPGARSPGLVPVSQAPRLERDDFVFNANDSHWLSNPLAPLTGFSPMYGFERTPRTPRTRMNAQMLLDDAGTWSGADRRFELRELEDAVFSNRGLLADSLRDAVVARCRAATAPVPYDGEQVDLSAACGVLAAWDLRLDVDSKGAVLWREVLGDFPAAATLDAGELWAEPFDPSTGVTAIATPKGLAPAAGNGDRVQRALAGAVLRLRRAGLPLDVKLGAVQGTVRGLEYVPVHGGIAAEGVINIVRYGISKSTVAPPMRRGTVQNAATGLTFDNGYPINNGTSFVMALEYTDDGPRAEALLTYGQVDDPASPYAVDQSRRFAQKAWRRLLVTDAEISAGMMARDLVVSGSAPTTLAQ